MLLTGRIELEFAGRLLSKRHVTRIGSGLEGSVGVAHERAADSRVLDRDRSDDAHAESRRKYALDRSVALDLRPDRAVAERRSGRDSIVGQLVRQGGTRLGYECLHCIVWKITCPHGPLQKPSVCLTWHGSCGIVA